MSQEDDELKLEDIDSPEPKKLDLDDSGTKLKLKRTNTFRLNFNTNIEMMSAIRQLERTNSEAIGELKIVSYASNSTSVNEKLRLES